jgi:uncharacterized protein (DUF1501 family)
MKHSRRDFLKTSLSSLAYFSAAGTVPAWIARSAHAIQKTIASDRILIIVQQAGGNDGLNTVIPYTDPLYNGDTLRPNLHITSGFDLTTLDSLNAFHPKMVRLTDWFKDGKLAVMQCVGYPNPNLSHFTATDYWEEGRSPGSSLSAGSGWIARYFDNACAGTPPENIDPLAMMAAGHFKTPLTMEGSALYTPPAVYNFDSYGFFVPDNAYGEHFAAYQDALLETAVINPQVDFVQRAINTAQASVEDIETASQQPEINPYPAGTLGAGLDITSKIIRAGFDTHIFYVSQGGYDTHANQFLDGDPTNAGAHPQLLEEFDTSLDAFLSDMDASGNLDRCLILSFSEFGRRIAENLSKGTDHGAGNCMFAMGGKVDGGVYGGQPDLADLLSGNLRHKTDFRSVYARVLQDWLGVNPEDIFGAEDFSDPIFNIGAGMAQVPFIAKEGGGEINADVNEDGNVNIIDLQHVVDKVLGADVPHNTDVNNDGHTNIVDVQDVVNEILDQ